MTAADALQGVSRVLLDTSPVIYTVEQFPTDPGWTDRHLKVWDLLSYAVRHNIDLVVSPLTLTEVCMKPKADVNLVNEFQAFCTATEGIYFEAFNYDDLFAFRVASLSRTAGLKLPDSVQIAFAEARQCDLILTNDRRMAERSTVKCVLVDDLQLP